MSGRAEQARRERAVRAAQAPYADLADRLLYSLHHVLVTHRGGLTGCMDCGMAAIRADRRPLGESGGPNAPR